MSEGFIFGLEVVDLAAEDLELGLSLDAEAEGALSILKQPEKLSSCILTFAPFSRILARCSSCAHA